MKLKTLLPIAILIICAGWIFAGSFQDTTTGNGRQLGNSNDKLAFFGAAPVAQQSVGAAVTNTPVYAALTVSSQSITFAGVDGSTNTISVVTNVVINACAGFTTTNQVNSSTTLINAYRTALRNLGLSQ